MFAQPALGLGEYIALWAIIIALVMTVLGAIFGTPAVSALVFFVLAVVTVILLYAVLSRALNKLLHGSWKKGGGGGTTTITTQSDDSGRSDDGGDSRW